METDSPLYNELNRAWKSTCRILLGEEIGELKEYEEWLSKIRPTFLNKTSSISGKNTVLSEMDYCESAKFVSLNEARELSVDPLTINEVKDIDSILEAVSEKWEYTGDKILGNSSFVEQSDSVMNSQYVFNSTYVRDSSKIYGSIFINEGSKCVFGSYWVNNCEFMINCEGLKMKRCFESYWMDNGGDLYYSFCNIGCSDLMFSFNQRNKRNCIGNLQLSKEKYSELKKKLVEEIREELKKSKDFPSLMELVPNVKPKNLKLQIKPTKREEDFGPIEKAFSTTSRILFKKELKDVRSYENWLSRHVPKLPEFVSPFGSQVYAPEALGGLRFLPENRIVSLNETMELGKIALEEKDIQSLGSIRKAIDKIGFFIGEMLEDSRNTIDCSIAYKSANLYRVADGAFLENSAIDGLTFECKNLFGSNQIYNSQFCINCYSSLKAIRCFELDNCTNCSDSYFAHNCEGLQDTMFCWNVKSKRHAIGNSPLPPEQYRMIKDSLVSQMADEISKNKELKYDIFNIGCGKQ